MVLSVEVHTRLGQAALGILDGSEKAAGVSCRGEGYFVGANVDLIGGNPVSVQTAY